MPQRPQQVNTILGGNPKQLPDAQALSGDENITIQQDNKPVQTTTQAIANLGGGGPPSWLPDGALLFMDFVNGHYYADGAVVEDPADLMVFNADYTNNNVGIITDDGWTGDGGGSGFVLPDDVSTPFLSDGATAVIEASFSVSGNGFIGPEFCDLPLFDLDWYAYTTADYTHLFSNPPSGHTNSDLVGFSPFVKVAQTFAPSQRAVASINGKANISRTPDAWPAFTNVGFTVNLSVFVRSITLYVPKPDAELPILSAIPVVQNGPAVLAPLVTLVGSELVVDGDLATDPTLSGWTLGLDAIWSPGQIASSLVPDNDPAFSVPVPTVSGSWYKIAFDQSISGDASGVYFDNNSGYWVRDQNSAVIVFQADFTGDDVLWLDFDNYNPGATRTITSVSFEEVEEPVAALTTLDNAGYVTLSLGAEGLDTANVFFGEGALVDNTGNRITAFGRGAGGRNVGNRVVLFGDGAGHGNTGTTTAAFGSEAGLENNGDSCVFTGNEAGKFNTVSNVTVVGAASGRRNTGVGLTAAGTSAGINNTGAVNTFIGMFANSDTGARTNSIAIGANAVVMDDNTVQLGDSNVENLYVGNVPVVVAGNGPLVQEVGTWTPVLSFTGGTTGITYSGQFGQYVKTGKMVTVNFAIALTSKGSDVGIPFIDGAPFSGLLFDPPGVGSLIDTVFTGAGAVGLSGVIVKMAASGTMLLRTYDAASGLIINLDDTFFTNTTNITGTCTYMVN